MKTEDRRINPYKLFVGSFVPNWLLTRTEVSQGAKLAYARLMQYAGEHGVAFPRRETISAELGISESQYDRYVKELVDKHQLIEVDQRGLGQANRYYFLRHPWIVEAMTSPDSAYMRTQDSADTQTPLKRISRRESVEDIPQGFEDFWKEYPKKIKKEQARKAWNKLRPAPDLRNAILAAVRKQKLSSDWTKDSGKYIPHAITWLNGRRWEDEVEVAPEFYNAPPRTGVWDVKLKDSLKG